MTNMTSGMGRIVATVCIVAAGACADAPTAPRAGGSANPMVACTPDDGCGGTGYVGSSVPHIIMRGFEDRGGGPTHEYFELRHRAIVNGQEVHYTPVRIHADAFRYGEFASGIDLGWAFPCVGTVAVNIVREEVYFGHPVTDSPVATIVLTSADNGLMKEFWNPKEESMGYVRYTWSGCE